MSAPAAVLRVRDAARGALLGAGRRARELGRRYGLDAGLLACSAICFALFLHGSLRLAELAGIARPLATLTVGSLLRKAHDWATFAPAAPGQQFFDMDAAWVGKGGKAELVLDRGEKLALSEKTLVILKRPFKPDERRVEQKVRVLKGTVTREDEETRPVVEGVEEIQAPPEEAVKPSLPEGAMRKFNPPDNALVFRREAESIPMKFGWPEPLSGHLVVRNVATGRTVYAALDNASHGDVVLEKTNSLYFWQIVDAGKKVILGPFRFELMLLTDESVKAALKSGADRPTEIHW